MILRKIRPRADHSRYASPVRRRQSDTGRKRILFAVVAVIALMLFFRSRSPVPTAGAMHIFSVSKSATTSQIKEKLFKEDFMQGKWFVGFAMLLHGGFWRVSPGGYRLTEDMGAWEIAGILTSPPPLIWVTIPEGLRKEQIAGRLASALQWAGDERDHFLAADVREPYGLTEGFYFPDTYLIPLHETGAMVARRFVDRFNENVDPLVPGFNKANIKLDTAITLASIIQREAGGKDDMPLIAGILWNRLLIHMPLEVDATLQYARGDAGSGYWAPVTVADKKIDSSFNTYRHSGIPPSPIANPGLDAITAVLHATDTPCLFYLHDASHQIHCAKTYAEHLRNIETYLRHPASS